MKLKPVNKKASTAAKQKSDGLAPLIAEVRELIVSARNAAASTVNTLQVLTNFEIGRRIVEHEKKGEKRAEYGSRMLKRAFCPVDGGIWAGVLTGELVLHAAVLPRLEGGPQILSSVSSSGSWASFSRQALSV